MGNTLPALLILALAQTISGFVFAQELTWTGCGISKKAFMSALAKTYEQKTGVKIVLSGGGATKGIRATSAGESDMGGACRHLIDAPEEKNVKLVPVGWDALVVITHPSNPVKDIALDKIKKVFLGEISNWKDLGGAKTPVKLAVRQGKISGVGRMARELIFHNPDKDFSATAREFRSSGPVEKFVEANRNALALTGISSGRKRKVSFMSIDGVEPTYENIASGAYHLFRPLYLTTAKKASPEVKAFVKFAKGPEGQAIIKAEGTVNLRDGGRLWTPYRKAMKKARQIGNF